MKKFSILIVAAFALTACGQADQAGDNPEEAPPQEESATMPAMTYTASETKPNDSEQVLDVTVEFTEDGTWQSNGTVAAQGELDNEQVTRMAELVAAEDFPEDPDFDAACPTVIPPYVWTLTVGEDRVTNSNGGCVSSEPAREIAEIIQEVTGVGPTEEENQ